MDVLIQAQVIILIFSAPLCAALAAFMLLHRPLAKPKFWYSLAVLIGLLSLVGLRDAQLINDASTTNVGWFLLRTAKVGAIIACLWFALREKEPDHHDNEVFRHARDIRQDEEKRVLTNQRRLQDETAVMQAETGLINTERGLKYTKLGIEIDAERNAQHDRRDAMDAEQKALDVRDNQP
jgi:hypothetical protein